MTRQENFQHCLFSARASATRTMTRTHPCRTTKCVLIRDIARAAAAASHARSSSLERRRRTSQNASAATGAQHAAGQGLRYALLPVILRQNRRCNALARPASVHLASARHHTSCREREGGNPRLTTRSSHHSRPFFSKTRNSRPGARAHLLVLPACTGVGGRCLRSADGPRGAITRAAQEHDQRAVAKVATARCLSSIQAHHEPFGWKDLPKPRSLAATGASRWQLLHLCKNRGSHAASRCQAGVATQASGNCRRRAGSLCGS